MLILNLIKIIFLFICFVLFFLKEKNESGKYATVTHSKQRTISKQRTAIDSIYPIIQSNQIKRNISIYKYTFLYRLFI